MRWLWGLCLSLAVFTVVTAKPASHEDSDHADLEMEAEFITELLTNLLVPAVREGRQIDEEQEEEQDEEEVVEVVEVAKAEEAEVEGEAMEDSEALKEAKKVEVSRFNNYIDAIYRRMNAALKAKLMDPMELNLDEKAKKNEGKKVKSENTRVLREALDEEDTEIDVDRMGKPAKKRAGKLKGMSKEERLAEKKKRRERKKKKNDAKDKKTEMKEKKMNAKEKKKEMKEKKEKKMEMKAKKSKDPKEKKMEAKRKRKNKDVRESRSNRKNRNKKKGQNKNKGKQSNKQKNNNKRGKDSKKNNEKKARKGNDGNDEKMVGSLSGIATMVREGDVTVVDEETHKVVTSEFSVGPLQLQVSKIYGRGKARTVKTAKAITDVMSGTLVLKVKPDGTAHVKKVVFKKPENVEVKGKLSDNDPRSLNYLRNSVNKMRPLAAMKVLKTARYVLKSPNSN